MPNYGKAAPRAGAKTSSTKKPARGSVAPKKPHRKGATAPREMGGNKTDRGSNWEPRAPRAEGVRKPRHTSEERSARGPRKFESRSPREQDDRTQRREWSDKPRFAEGQKDRPARKGYEGRNDRTERTDRPSRPYADRNDRPSRPYADRSERPAREGFRGERSAPRSERFDRDRNPYREDRVSRDRSRDTSFDGARKSNPNRKAFFEDKVLEKLEVTQSEIVSEETFQAMGLHPKLVIALSGMGAEVPFPIQKATIPAGLQGRDVLGRGKTGSGKTIAFGVPVISKLVAAGSQPRRANKPRALILAPTRELADQIDRTVSALARSVGFYTTCVYGGVPQRRQEIAMSRGVDILVATPGRLEDLMAQRIIDLSEVETVVIDEADHMCDLGFIEGVKRVLRATGDSQKLLFSATLDREVDALVKEFLPNPYVYEVPNETEETSAIEHRVLICEQDDRSQVLLRLVQGEGKSLIFTRTKMTAERLSESLTNNGVPAARLHGDLNQNQRTRNLERFVKGQVRVLVATDVAARGIHVDDVALVIQVDPPEEYKTYLHRSGRTGRAGKEGIVITLIPRSKRRKVEDLLRRAERDAKFTDVRPGAQIVEDLAGPIAPAPSVPDVLDFGDSRGGGSNHRGRDRDRDSRPKKKGNYQGSGKGRWADKPSSEKRPRAKKYSN
jgi:superfamily II DNA/RNA helicase